MKSMPNDFLIPEKIDLARLAAFIDGEGCISIRERKDRRNGRLRTSPFVCITNTDIRLLAWLKENFEGSVCSKKTVGLPEHWKEAFEWRIEDRKAVRLLRLCLPYFIVKREQAEIAISHEDLVRSLGNMRTPEGWMKYREAREERLSLRIALANTKTKGKRISTPSQAVQ